MGDSVPFFGDHVEESDGGNDFTSTLGVGGVVGTQFVIPSLVAKRSKSDTFRTPSPSPESGGIYRDKMLSKRIITPSRRMKCSCHKSSLAFVIRRSPLAVLPGKNRCATLGGKSQVAAGIYVSNEETS
jgi:hypothetical protein